MYKVLTQSLFSVCFTAFGEKWTNLQPDQPEWTLGGQHVGRRCVSLCICSVSAVYLLCLTWVAVPVVRVVSSDTVSVCWCLGFWTVS